MVPNGKPLVVIVGAGFAGINAAQKLSGAHFNILLVDRRNYHLFQPLLYQVATAGLSNDQIAYPVRSIFRKSANVRFRLAEVTGFDLVGKRLETTTGPIAYDYLLLAPGSVTNFFGLESVADYGFELKDLDDAEGIRNHILRMFELASYETDPVRSEALQTFIVVGGGPTGVECAGAITELIRLVLAKDYPEIDTRKVRITLMEMMDQLLPGYEEDLGWEAEKTLQKKGVDVRLGTTLEAYDGAQAKLKSGEVIPAYTLIWAAGVKAANVVDLLEAEQARQNRVVVEPTLQLPGHPEVFVVGDAAHFEEDGQPLPMVAPVAIQQAKLAANNIRHLAAGEELETFDYKDPGSLATIGRNSAVARVGRFKFRGFLAWLVWLAVHLFWLIGFRNRLVVLVNWAWDYFLYDRAIRLITPTPEETPVREFKQMDE